ncbi:MAG: beta-lactamase family protein [Opitutaceae bacterium]|jgi:CubicO group peptidase (beta-lactamase class C family)|nr:beta-lactamase family protein [Opitutaceae bacterium]
MNSIRSAGAGVFLSFVLAANLFAGRFADVFLPKINENILAGGVFLVADNEKILECEAAGFADIAARKPMREDALFWIASMTKSFTAVALMTLVDEGKLSLDDPVSKFIPEFAKPQRIVPEKKKTTTPAPAAAPKTSAANTNNAAKPAPAPASGTNPPAQKPRAQIIYNRVPLTVRHLLSHTSGLRGENPLWVSGLTNDIFPLADYVPLYAGRALIFRAGTGYRYSDANINVAGRIIEIVSGRSYGDFVRERVLEPLGLADTSFRPAGDQLARLAKTYNSDPAKSRLDVCRISLFFYPLDDRENRHPIPASGLFSTARDVAVFGQMLLNKGVHKGRRILSEKAVAEMTRAQTPPAVKAKYGLGLGLYEENSFGHGGLYSTAFRVWPEHNRVTVYMTQRRKPDGDNESAKIHSALRALVIPQKKKPEENAAAKTEPETGEP